MPSNIGKCLGSMYRLMAARASLLLMPMLLVGGNIVDANGGGVTNGTIDVVGTPPATGGVDATWMPTRRNDSLVASCSAPETSAVWAAWPHSSSYVCESAHLCRASPSCAEKVSCKSNLSLLPSTPFRTQSKDSYSRRPRQRFCFVPFLCVMLNCLQQVDTRVDTRACLA